MAASKKDFIKRLLLALPGFQALCRRLSSDHVRVLMYHRFSPGAGDAQKLGAAHFDRQLAYLVRHHAVWTPDRHVQSKRDREQVDTCPAVLTIDDGYRDFAEVAKPLLDEHAVSAALFVVTDFVSGKIWFWWDKLRYVLDTTQLKELNICVGGQRYHMTLTGSHDRNKAWSRIATDLSRMAPDETASALASISSELDIDIPDKAPDEFAAVSWEQLGNSSGKNLILGAHTRTHPALSRISAQQAAEEIDASRQAIIAHTGACSDVFCYPHGQKEDYSADTLSVVAELGFTGAYVAYESSERDRDMFEMERYSVHDDWVDFRWKLCGAQHLLRRM